jgi:hypothetical protein
MFRNDDVSDGGLPILVTAPTVLPITLANCKAALGVTDTTQDAVITAALNAVTASLDPAQLGWLGRALRPQTWQLQLRSFYDVRPPNRRRDRSMFPLSQVNVPPGFNNQAIPLPYPPLISIGSVKYLDANGVDQTLALGTGYRILGVGQTFGRQAIAPPYNGTWPAARVDEASVRIQYTCGYDDVTNMMPPQLTQAICLGVRALLPLLTRDNMVMEDRVEGIGLTRYQNNPAIAGIIEKAIGSLLANLAIA